MKAPRVSVKDRLKALRRIQDAAGSREIFDQWCQLARDLHKEKPGPTRIELPLTLDDWERLVEAPNLSDAIRNLMRKYPALKRSMTEERSTIDRIRRQLRHDIDLIVNINAKIKQQIEEQMKQAADLFRLRNLTQD
jgi:hypothetical protein